MLSSLLAVLTTPHGQVLLIGFLLGCCFSAFLFSVPIIGGKMDDFKWMDDNCFVG